MIIQDWRIQEKGSPNPVKKNNKKLHIGKNADPIFAQPQPEHKTYIRKHSNRNIIKKASDYSANDKNDELQKLEEDKSYDE